MTRSSSRPKRVLIAIIGVTVTGLLLTATLLLTPPVASAQTAETEGTERRVVILNATDPYLPAFLVLDGALREAIHARSRQRTEFYAETLDMSRFPQALLDHDMIELLRKKYRGLRVDVVVAAAPIALDFAERHRADIWPGAAIVFNSVPEALLTDRLLDPAVIGIPVRLEFEGTLELALRLRPGTRQVAVIAGNGEPDARHVSLARRSLAPYAERIDIRYVVGLSLADTLAAVRELPADAIVLYLTMFRDGSGTPHVPRNVLARIASVSPVPVFGVFDTYVGHGIAAGAITGFAAQGRSAGELVARVLDGEDPAAIGVQRAAAPGCIADWQQLRRWGIKESLLPEGCDVRFRKVTAWDLYRWQIVAALALILAQAVLIVVLLLSRRSLRDAQRALRDEFARRTQAESVAAGLRGRLRRFSKERSLGAMATAIAHEINQPLIAIQNYAQAARRRLQGGADDRPKLLELFGKIEAQAERAGTITQRVRSLVGTSEVRLAPVRLLPIVDEVIRVMEHEIEGRGCRIACEPATDLPAVLADALQVQLVLINLLRNAMESVTSSDGNDRRVRVDLQPLGGREVQVSVTDRGPGVPPERAAEIFEPLASGKSGGMGVGLAISRAIIEAHGGRLWHEPNPAGGAIFRFTLRAVGSEEA